MTDPKTKGLETEPSGASSPGPVDLSPKATETVDNLETPDLTVREQLMRQWPSWDWETR